MTFPYWTIHDISLLNSTWYFLINLYMIFPYWTIYYISLLNYKLYLIIELYSIHDISLLNYTWYLVQYFLPYMVLVKRSFLARKLALCQCLGKENKCWLSTKKLSFVFRGGRPFLPPPPAIARVRGPHLGWWGIIGSSGSRTTTAPTPGKTGSTKVE